MRCEETPDHNNAVPLIGFNVCVGQKGMCNVKCPICLAKACFYSVPRYIPTLAFERIGPSEEHLSARVSSIRENANASHGPSPCPNRKRHIL